MNPGSNTVTYCNKSRRGVTAVYITTPDAESRNADAGAVAKNRGVGCLSFNCHIVGRWK